MDLFVIGVFGHFGNLDSANVEEFVEAVEAGLDSVADECIFPVELYFPSGRRYHQYMKANNY